MPTSPTAHDRRPTSMRRHVCAQLVAAVAVTTSVMGCGRQTESPVVAPGASAAVGTRALDAGAAVLQDKPPVDALNTYLDGFHFYSGRPGQQMEAHHHCSVLNEDVLQCVIFDGTTRDAKLMGVEYVVSARVFAGLPDAEKALWHSHVHEVKSGQLVAPGIPEPVERALMAKLVGTYGKTWHTWHTDQGHALPLGVPQLMMGFTGDVRADPSMVSRRDARLGIDSEQRRQQRAGLPTPPVDPGADAWQRGHVIQLADPTGAVHGAPHAADGAASSAATASSPAPGSSAPPR